MGLIDWLFPKTCVGCFREGTWLCGGCAGLLVVSRDSCCADCDSAAAEYRFCDTCKGAHYLSGLVSLGHYHHPPLRRAIQAVKYESVLELADSLGKMLAPYRKLLPESGLVLPVPLHPKRLAERGYNQAELFARQLDGFCAESILVRYRHRSPQAQLDLSKRAANIRGVFAVQKNAADRVRGRTIILVDDVSTTGSTLDEAARVLLKAGAAEVWGLVLAKG